jgi:hypothetical protein
MFINFKSLLPKRGMKVTYLKMQEIYFPLIYYKEIDWENIVGMEVIKAKTKIESLNSLEKKYNNYILLLKNLDNINNVTYNNLESKRSHLYLNKNLSLLNYKIHMKELFNKKKGENEDLTIEIKSIQENIYLEHLKDIKNRKMSNRLKVPYYFFTTYYNEKSMPSQIKHWTSSVYNFLKKEKTGNNYLDIYTAKLIKLFFNIKYLKRKNIWDIELLKGFKITSNISIFKDINTIMKYTSNRTNSSLKELNVLPSFLLTFKWVIEQLSKSRHLSKIIDEKKNTILSGYYPKKREYLRKLTRVVISKPFFKHTSYNLIIDLFVFNNKAYKIGRLKNMVTRRSLYKYMYSMYINYTEKIKETLHRPRFFYINLIEPKTFTYYHWVIKFYQEILIRKNKSLIAYIYLLILQLNYINKNKIQILKNRFSSILNKYYKILKNNKLSNFDIYDTNKNSIVNKVKSEEKVIIKKKYTKEKKSKYLLYKKYLLELERKSNTPLDLNSLTLWNIDGLGNNSNNKIEKSNNKNKLKNFRYDKFSYKDFKRKNIYDNKSKKGRKISPKIWKKKLMSFFLFSRKQKKDTNPYKIIINQYNKEKIKEKNITSYNSINNFDSHEIIKIKSSFINNENKKDLSLSPQIIKTKEELNIKENILSSELKELAQIAKAKEEHIKDTNILMNEDNSNIFNNMFTKFYLSLSDKNNFIKKENKNLTLNLLETSTSTKDFKNSKIKVSQDLAIPLSLFKNKQIDKINNKKKNKFIYEERNIDIFNTQKKIMNTKVLWDHLDFSIINILNNYFRDINNRKSYFQNFETYSLYNKIKSFNNFGDIWYLLYFFNFIKKEYSLIKKDILLEDNRDIIIFNNKINPNYIGNTIEDLFLIYKNNINNIRIKLWPKYYSNKRENNINNKLGYNENIFKPYYRYFIPLLIIKSYYSFISYLGYNGSLFNFNKNFNIKTNEMNSYNLIIFNFIIVKTLLDLLHYNYRSLIKIKPRYYYLNKLRLYISKFRKLNNNSWLNSIKYFRKLRKTPRKFWIRYHKVASYYFERVIQNAELDTKRKVFLPFVLYFEDILFTIYGKWTVIRIWPLRKIFLSSFMLAKRILLLILWKRKFSHKQSFQYQTDKLINIIRNIQIKKAYNYYIRYSSKWPVELVNKMKDNQSSHSLNYTNLEFFNRKNNKNNNLNSYFVEGNNLINYLPNIENNYINAFNNNIKLIIPLEKRIKIWKDLEDSEVTRIQYIYYWLRPLKTYLLRLKQYTDISGIKFSISGRTGTTRSNIRALYKTRFYGNLLGPNIHSFKSSNKQTMFIPYLRGHLKSHFDYAKSVSTSNNGSLTFKVWISSSLSTDTQELLLYLIQIKDLYNHLVNKYYLIDNKFVYIKDYNYYTSTQNKIFNPISPMSEEQPKLLGIKKK